jgi:ribonucleoside-diphosphate reductase alpha subunit
MKPESPIIHHHTMEVIKRNGKAQRVSFDKVIYRLESLCEGLNREYVDPIQIALETIKGFHPNITTEEIDNLSASICAHKIMDHPDFNKLAGRILVSNLHKMTCGNFKEVVEKLYNHVDKDGDRVQLVSKELYEIVQEHADEIQNEIKYDRDFLIDFFGLNTLKRSYLIRTRKDYLDEGTIIERPQDMFMRVSIGIHGYDLKRAFQTYHLMSQKYFIHATPTLFNAGTPRSQCSSCFLLYVDDSMEGIADNWKECAMISKNAGGIGVCISDIRSRGSKIRGTNGVSSGVVKLCKTYNDIARYVNQGGKRNGSIAVYMETWHADIFDFINLRTPQGNDDDKARDLFLGLWVCDLFMKQLEEDGDWYLMCPNQCKGLTDSYGDEFEKLYWKYVKEGKYRKKVKAQDLMAKIIDSQIESGMPYMLYKDNVNKKSNQKNIGVIKQSNLCAEIVEVSNNEESAVCNLANIALPAFVEEKNGRNIVNYKKLHEVAGILTENLNRIIDINYYPSEKTKRSNLRHRPIGIGVQGLANLYNILNLPFDSEEALIVNEKIFETIYHGALTASCRLAKEYGPYETFEGSPFSKGELQWHMWGLTNDDLHMDWNWNELIDDIVKYGVRNSLLTAIMPTASTSQILGYNECIEPFTTNLYTRKTLAGTYIIVNEHLVSTLIKHKLWNDDIKNKFKYFNGSIQKIDEIPDDIKNVYKTAYEIKQSSILKQSASRGPFIDQTQSLNLFMNEVDTDLIYSIHNKGWSLGLKTGLYYLRGKPAQDPIKFGLDTEVIEKIERDMEKKTGSRFKYINESPVNESPVNESPSIDILTDFDSNKDDDSQSEKEEPKKFCQFSLDGNAEGCLACQ